MTTLMDGIEQQSLFAGKVLTMDVIVGHGSRYRVLAENLPWRELGIEANRWRAKKVDLDNGRPLNLRLHLGALIAQSMNGWTDRETEDMVAHHAAKKGSSLYSSLSYCCAERKKGSSLYSSLSYCRADIFNGI